MGTMKIKDSWYYVIVRDPNTSTEQFVGFSDENTEKKFLPVFKTKQDAKACFALMPKDLFNGDYDVHAVIEEDIMGIAQDKGHNIFLLDDQGSILKQMA